MAALLSWIGNERVSRPVFDSWQRLMPQPATPRATEIVWIDEPSIRTLGPWPWPRYTMARLVAKLAEDEPRLIGLDMLFAEPDRQDPEAFAQLYPELRSDAAAAVRALPSMDALFGQVIGQAPVVLGRAGVDAAPRADALPLPVEARFTAALPPGVRQWGQALANIRAIDDVGLGHGLLNGAPDGDGVVRHVPLAAMVAGQTTPGFALELVRIASDAEAIGVNQRDGRLTGFSIAGQSIPARPDGTMRVPFHAPSARAPISALDILYDLAPSQRVKGKIVIVGLSGAGTADIVSTPLAPEAYGATVHADGVDAMLAGASLFRPRWAWIAEGMAAILLVVIAIRVLPRLPMVAAAAAGMAAVILLFGTSAFAFRGGLLLDPVSPLLTAGAAAATMLLLLFAKTRADLQEQRLQSAQAAGELSAARTIQLGMLPRPEALDGLSEAARIDALIEPARSIGGDFYDAIQLDGDRVCVLVGDVTGKGVPAALFMALSKALTKSVLLRDGHDLGAAVTRLNDEIARDNGEDMFVTMLVAVLDTGTGAVELCCAGHEDPWIVRASGAVEPLRPDGGPPLAVAPGFSYVADRFPLEPGDSIVIVSDGITEAQSPDGGFFGKERIAAILARWAERRDAATVSAMLLEEVRLFEAGADATDDLTVLVLRYLT